MAIVNSLAIGKSVKSAGNLTYKTVRGRTIASQRITSNKSNTAAQASQRYSFGQSSLALKLIQQYIAVCYEKSKYGSSRNAFFKTNPKFNLGGLVGEVNEGITSVADGMLAALTGDVRQLSVLSSGSLAGFLSVKYSSVASYKYKGHTYENLRVIATEDGSFNGVGMYDFSFSSAVRFSDLKLYFFGFSDGGLLQSVGTIDKATGLFEFDNDGVSPHLTQCRPNFTDETKEYVSSVHVEVTMADIENCPIAVIVPSVGGKVPTLTGVFAKASEV